MIWIIFKSEFVLPVDYKQRSWDLRQQKLTLAFKFLLNFFSPRPDMDDSEEEGADDLLTDRWRCPPYCSPEILRDKKKYSGQYLQGWEKT